MVYKIFTQDEQDDVIVSFYLAQEKDAFCHETNLSRFDEMLKTLPEGEWKTRVTQLRDQTIQRLSEVKSILQATELQLPSKDRLEASKTRIRGSGQ